MASPKISIANLKAHVQALAGEIGERNVFRPRALRRVEKYIERTWRAQGAEVVGSESTPTSLFR